MLYLSAKHQDLLSDERPFLRRTHRDHINLVQKSCQVLRLCVVLVGESGMETSWSQTLKNWRRWTHQNSTPEGSMQRKCYATKTWKLHIPSRRWNSQNLRERRAPENIHLNPGTSGTRRRTRKSSGNSEEWVSPSHLQEDSARDDEEAKNDFWTVTG